MRVEVPREVEGREVEDSGVREERAEVCAVGAAGAGSSRIGEGGGRWLTMGSCLVERARSALATSSAFSRSRVAFLATKSSFAAYASPQRPHICALSRKDAP